MGKYDVTPPFYLLKKQLPLWKKRLVQCHNCSGRVLVLTETLLQCVRETVIVRYLYARSKILMLPTRLINCCCCFILNGLFEFWNVYCYIYNKYYEDKINVFKKEENAFIENKDR